jgi:hypothetical protein
MSNKRILKHIVVLCKVVRTEQSQSLFIKRHTHNYEIFSSSSKFQSIFTAINQMERMNFKYSLTDSSSSMRTVKYLYNFTRIKKGNNLPKPYIFLCRLARGSLLTSKNMIESKMHSVCYQETQKSWGNPDM